MSRTFFDDNYGHWDEQRMEDPDAVDFYHQVQAESIWKRCQGCGNLKKLRPDYGYCNTCATMIEHGGDLDPPDEAFLDPAVDMELQLQITRERVEQEIARQAVETGNHEQFEDEE